MQAIEINEIAAENYFDADAFAVFLDRENPDMEEAVDAFADCYAGTFDTLAAFAENLADEIGLLSEIPQNLQCYFDFEAYGRDLHLGGDVWTADTPSGTAVFWNR